MFHFNPPSSRINALKKSALFVYSVGIGLFLLVSGTTLSAQWAPSQDTRFPFSSESLDRIDIVIDQDSLDIILQDGNQLSDYEFPATFIYTYRKPTVR